MVRERLFRDEHGAALERIARLEEENRRLRAEAAGAAQPAGRRSPALLVAIVLGACGLSFALMGFRSDRRAVPSAAPPAAESTGPSYEAVLASDLAVKGLPGATTEAAPISDAELDAPLHDGDLLRACGAPVGTRITVMVAVRDGEAAGVTVRSAPYDAAIESCVRREVRSRRWPTSPALSTRTADLGP